MKYDVVIIGAGPAGVAAAHNLINNNISCVLIDKQKFPRNKLCAGGITSKSFELMKILKLDEFESVFKKRPHIVLNPSKWYSYVFQSC